jgi:plastocyanin
MKKSTIMFAFLLFAAFQTLRATNFNITISGFAYSPTVTIAAVGDVITIAASGVHPLVEVSQADWNTNTPTAVGSWTNKTTAYTYTITTATDFYFGCANHMASMGMKGMISVAGSGITTSSVNYAISVFPNPVLNGEFTVKAEGYNGSNGKILIYDVEGKLLETHNLSGVSTPVKTKLPSGVYFYDVMINSKREFRGKFLSTYSGK